jgi:cysteine synthase
MKLDISAHELEEAYEDILTILGAFSIEVDIEKKEVKIVLKRAFQEFEKETSIWQLQNQFSNVYGMPAGQQMFNQISTFNMNFVTQITDWFASMNRVGGKIP